MNVPLALYVHLPWCVRKCPYCDFNSHTAGKAPPRSRYLDALAADLAGEAELAGGRTVESVFLGGGTPSLFSGEEIGRLLEAVRDSLTLAADAEVTLEANPGTVERHNLAGYRAAGVNRLSLGAQSFDDATLARLGRIHSAADVAAAVAEARRAGFDNLNLDLMFALPGQTPAMAAADVERALALEPEHVSYYQLTLEPNTVFGSRPPADLPDDDTAARIESHGHDRLAAAGFERYEISAFARPGRRCRHNLNYWSFGDYLAAGAGAHGKITGPDGRIRRYRKPNHPLFYINALEQGPAASPASTERRSPTKPRSTEQWWAAGPASMERPSAASPASTESRSPTKPRSTEQWWAAGPASMERPSAVSPTSIPDQDVAFEYMLNVLRLPAGFSERLFTARTGLPIAAIAGELERAVADGLMERPAAGCWRPSERGLRFLNDLQGRFLPRPPAAADR